VLRQYLWPEGHGWLKARVLLAISLLIGAKLLTIQVPFLFKDIIDRLTPGTGADLSAAETAVLAVPIALLLGCEYSRQPCVTTRLCLRDDCLHDHAPVSA
jgi:hypothetical protein